MLDQAGGLDGATLLDVGCGDGLIGLAALERVGRSGRLVFAGISPALLEHAEKAARDLGLAERARFVQTDAAQLGGIADGSVDVITTRSVLIYLANRPPHSQPCIGCCAPRLAEPERHQLLDHLRDRFAKTLPVQPWAAAYLQAGRGSPQR